MLSGSESTWVSFHKERLSAVHEHHDDPFRGTRTRSYLFDFPHYFLRQCMPGDGSDLWSHLWYSAKNLHIESVKVWLKKFLYAFAELFPLKFF